MKRAIIYIHSLAVIPITASTKEMLQEQFRCSPPDVLYVHAGYFSPSTRVSKFYYWHSCAITPSEQTTQESKPILASTSGQAIIDPEKYSTRKRRRKQVFFPAKNRQEQFVPGRNMNASRFKKVPP